MGLVLYPFVYKAFYSMINIMKILKIAKFKLKSRRASNYTILGIRTQISSPTGALPVMLSPGLEPELSIVALGWIRTNDFKLMRLAR